MQSDGTELAIGEVLGERYEILARLNEGSMGVVYLGLHRLIKKKVAIKVLRNSLRDRPDIVERFRREAQATANIDHRNVCATHDFGESKSGFFYLVMEYLEGETLLDLIARSAPLSINQTLEIIGQVCSGLRKAHSLGFVHRDLKPENLMLIGQEDNKFLIKIMDFGLTTAGHDLQKRSQRLTQEGVAYGTPFYMSPEQVSGDEVDVRTDLYALGTIIFELLTGKRPFTGKTVAQILSRQITQPVPGIAETNPNFTGGPIWDQWLQRLLAKAPEDRFGSVNEFLAAVRSEFPNGSDSTSFMTNPQSTATLVNSDASHVETGSDIALGQTHAPTQSSRGVDLSNPDFDTAGPYFDPTLGKVVDPTSETSKPVLPVRGPLLQPHAPEERNSIAINRKQSANPLRLATLIPIVKKNTFEAFKRKQAEEKDQNQESHHLKHILSFVVVLIVASVSGWWLLQETQVGDLVDQVSDRVETRIERSQESAFIIERRKSMDALGLLPLSQNLVQSDKEDAYRQFDSALKANGKNAHLHFFLMQIEFRRGNIDASAKHLQESIALDERYRLDPIWSSTAVDLLVAPKVSLDALVPIVQKMSPKTVKLLTAEVTENHPPYVFQRLLTILTKAEVIDGIESWKFSMLQLRAANCKGQVSALSDLDQLKAPEAVQALQALKSFPKTGCGKREKSDCYRCVRKKIGPVLGRLSTLKFAAPPASAEEPSPTVQMEEQIKAKLRESGL